jgi:hypothetical protein
MGRPEEPYYTIVDCMAAFMFGPPRGEQFPQGGNPFLHTNHAWNYEVLPPDES